MRRFEFSDGASNKFWEVEAQGHLVYIRFGKIGTSGQQQTKSFASDSEADSQCQKLIAEKTRKGYVEVPCALSNNAVGGTNLDENLFWTLISDSKRGTEGDIEEHIEYLTAKLKVLNDQDLIIFSDVLNDKLDKAYRADLWAAAYVDNGGCSDDAFTDWCSGLVLAGKKVYESVLSSPDSLANFEVGFSEEFSSVARDIWEERHPNQQMPSKLDTTENRAIGELFPEDDVSWFCKHLPKLSAKHGLTADAGSTDVEGVETTVFTITIKCDLNSHDSALRMYELLKARMQCVLVEDSEAHVVVKARSEATGWAMLAITDTLKQNGYPGKVTISTETQRRPQTIG
ncbi:MAG TPA: DUF4240 domain-containing protein [Drouetiella sp.]